MPMISKKPKSKRRGKPGPKRKPRKVVKEFKIRQKRKYTKRVKPESPPEQILGHMPQSGLSIVQLNPDAIPPLRSSILTDARDLTLGDRNRAYGDPLENFEAIANLKKAFWDAVYVSSAQIVKSSEGDADFARLPNEPKFTQNSPFGHAIDMVFNNLGRISSAPTREAGIARDRFLDGVNYLAIAGEIAERLWGKSAETEKPTKTDE